MIDTYREGVLVKPYERLSQEQVQWLDQASLSILADPGIWCYNERAAKLFQAHGAKVWEDEKSISPCWRVTFPAGLIREAVAKAPARLVLGARKPENRLLLDAELPRVYFGSGSEANIWLETEMEEFISVKDGDVKVKVPRFKELRGNSALLSRAAKLCDRLEHLDFFIRPLNIQDPEITSENHDVNKFFASLNNITKHVQAGLTTLEKLNDVVRMAEIIAGGIKPLRENPVVSFIACVFKSPLQIVDDTAEKVFAIVESGLPLVIYIFSPFFNYPLLRHASRQVLGSFGMIAGSWITLTGIVLVVVGWRKIHRAKDLVTGGIYRYIRHPQYAGLFLIMSGWLLHWPTLLTLILFPILIMVYYRLAVREENEMLEVFGSRYEIYMKQTPRFFPNFKKIRQKAA